MKKHSLLENAELAGGPTLTIQAVPLPSPPSYPELWPPYPNPSTEVVKKELVTSRITATEPTIL